MRIHLWAPIPKGTAPVLLIASLFSTNAIADPMMSGVFSGADFKSADLTGADLRNADFSDTGGGVGADFSGANLTDIR